MGAADSRCGECSLHGINGVVVELVVLFGSAPPVEDVGLVPDFPVPSLNFRLAVALDAMTDPLKHKLGPLLVVFRWVSPTGRKRLATSRNPFVLVRLGVG